MRFYFFFYYKHFSRSNILLSFDIHYSLFGIRYWYFPILLTMLDIQYVKWNNNYWLADYSILIHMQDVELAVTIV